MLRQQHIGSFQRGMPAAPEGTCAGSANGEAGYAESAAAASRHASPAICSGVCHGTLGELLQGPYEHDGELHIGLISLPVRKYSWVHFTPGEAGDIEVELAGKDKCRRAIELYLRHYRKRLPAGRWSHDSELLLGKGMASSTADLVATIRCLDRIFGLHSPAPVIAALLREIERSDSVFLDTHALYLSSRQEIVRAFDAPVRLHACYIDEGGTVETEKVAHPLLAHYQRNLPAYRHNLDRAIDAFARHDLRRICECSTRSAELAQGVIAKRNLEVLLERRRDFAADGIVVAHTGSLLGYLFIARPDPARMGELSSFFRGLGHQCRFAETGF